MASRPNLRLRTIARLINEHCPGYRAEIVAGFCNTDRKISGTRMRSPGKGREGNRLIVRGHGRVVIDHNAAETYRTNAEVMDKIEARWGRIWEHKL